METKKKYSPVGGAIAVIIIGIIMSAFVGLALGILSGFLLYIGVRLVNGEHK